MCKVLPPPTVERAGAVLNRSKTARLSTLAHLGIDGLRASMTNKPRTENTESCNVAFLLCVACLVLLHVSSLFPNVRSLTSQARTREIIKGRIL